MLKITGEQAFRASVDAWFAKLKQGLEKAVYTMAIDAQQYATSISPIHTGDFASNWNVSWGSPNTRFIDTRVEDYYSDRGNPFPYARTAAWGVGEVNMGGYGLGSTVYLSNSAEHDEPYAFKIEHKQIVFRPVNAGKDRVAGKTALAISERYKTITAAMMV